MATKFQHNFTEAIEPANQLLVQVVAGKGRKNLTYIKNIDRDYDLKMIAKYLSMKHGTNVQHIEDNFEIIINGDMALHAKNFFMKLGYKQNRILITGRTLED
ncbi:MAG: Eukaryotic translation initiation factor 1b [Marteilia pararefringens]